MVCLLLVTACREDSPSGPTVVLDQQFTLAPGQTAMVEGTALRVAFIKVSGDSRCPADALCIQGGDALVHVRVEAGGNGTEYELHTGDSSRAGFWHGGYRIELANLHPYPFSSRTIRAEDYRATITVTR
jgi:hypothetical protein